MQFTSTTRNADLGSPYRVDTFPYPIDLQSLVDLELFLNETAKDWTLINSLAGPENIVFIHKRND